MQILIARSSSPTQTTNSNSMRLWLPVSLLSGMEDSGRVNLSLVYTINRVKTITVGLFEQLNFEVGILFTQHSKKQHILLDFTESNYLLLFNDRKTRSSFLCK